MRKQLTAMLLLLLFTLTAGAQESFVSGGKTRNMIVYAPKNLKENRPLLISLHGMNQDAAYQRSQANYEAVADTAKFVVVYPDGEGRSWDLGGTKDINFILDIINEMYKRYKINKSRVYLSGFSMGGMMTYYAMTKIADKIAAFAPVSGYNMGGPNAQSSRPVPIFHVHGTGDDVCTYSPVQSHIDAWVKRNKCNSSPVIEKPKTGPSNTTATIARYKNGLDGVEVAHLKMPGKGHWHSNDPAMAMTNVEIWNFCQRFSLVEGPKMLTVTPEDESFDMQSDANRTFTVTFDKAVDCSSVKGSLVKSGISTTLVLDEQGESKVLTFHLPEAKTLDDGIYTFKVTGLESTDGGKGADVNATYTYGIEEVGEQLKMDTLLVQDWYSQRDAIGEGIPTGWIRVNSRSDGTKDEKKSGAKDTGGCRMKYFTEGGDFNAGFYLSSRDYDVADFYYGGVTGRSLLLKKAKYIISFNSIYWNAGARDSKNTFSVSILNKTTKSVVWSEPSLTPKGCLNEVSDQKVTGSQRHEIICDLPAATSSLLQFSMSAGWNGIIISEPTITTCPTAADIYKGGFLRTLAKANAMCEDLTSSDTQDAMLLRDVITEYASFTSTSPSEYAAATKALEAAMQAIIASGIAVMQPQTYQSGALYNLMGCKVTGTPSRGIYIRDGKKVLIK